MAKANSSQGGGFALAASAGHFDFLGNLLAALNANGHDISIFFLAYSLTPSASYPIQLREAVESLRYILNDTNRDPSNVMLGGDSAGGNLALAVLLHLTHPHPEIDPLPISKPLRGVFAFAPWVSFRADWPSLEQNRYKDIIPKEALSTWSRDYLNGKEGDPWSEPSRAPTEWWKGAMAEQVLVLAGGGEILLSAIEEFVERFKVCSSFCGPRLPWLVLICRLSSRILRMSWVTTRLMSSRCIALPSPGERRSKAGI